MQEHIDNIISFSRTNPVIAGIIGLVLLIFMVRKTKLFFGLLVLLLLLWGAFSLIMDVADIGGGVKQKAIKKSGVEQDVQ